MAKLRWCVLAVLVGCGGAAPPPPAPVATMQAPAPAPAPVAPAHVFDQRAACDGAAHHLIARPFNDDRIRSAVLSEGPSPGDHFYSAINTACIDGQWSPEVVDCVDAMHATQDSERCLSMMTSIQRDDLRQRVELAVTPGKLPTKTPMPAALAGLPQECIDYHDAIYALSQCSKFPKEARDAMRDAFDQASQAWVGLPPDAKASLSSACKAGTDAIKQATASSGCQ